MEMFLLATVTALLTVIIIDTGRKRRTDLCQRVRITKRRWPREENIPLSSSQEPGPPPGLLCVYRLSRKWNL